MIRISALGWMLLAIPLSLEAQTSVTLYGIAEGNLRLDHTNIGTLKSVGSGGESGNRWGIRGVEDLGDGLKASFIFEQGFDISDNSGNQGNIGGGASGGFGGSSTAPHGSTGARLFGRTAVVGLSGSFGSVRFGRDYSPTFLLQALVDPFGSGTVGLAANVFVNLNARNDNAVYYDTPRILGFQGSVLYQFGESTTDNSLPAATGQAKRGNDRVGAGFTYSNGPFFGGVAYEHIRSNLDLYAVQNFDAGAAYDFGFIKLHALYWATKNDNTNANSAFGSVVSLSERAYFVGATVPFGAWTLLGGYGHLDDRSTSNVAGSDLGRPRANFFAAGAKYSLSKRTILYAAYGRFDLKTGPNGNPFQGFVGIQDASNFGLETPANLLSPAGRSNVNPWTAQAGIRQSF